MIWKKCTSLLIKINISTTEIYSLNHIEVRYGKLHLDIDSTHPNCNTLLIINVVINFIHIMIQDNVFHIYIWFCHAISIQ